MSNTGLINWPSQQSQVNQAQTTQTIGNFINPPNNSWPLVGSPIPGSLGYHPEVYSILDIIVRKVENGFVVTKQGKTYIFSEKKDILSLFD